MSQRQAFAIACAVAAALCISRLPAAAARQTAPPTRITPDADGVGPQVGETVPDFTLPDAQGTPRNLRSLMGPRGATIVFFRSAD
jgi:hypothetical protein